MKPRRGTKLYWYHYHKSAAQSAAENQVQAQFSNLLAAQEEKVKECRGQRDEARRSEPWISKLQSLFGFETSYWKENIRPLGENLEKEQRKLSGLQQVQSTRLESARESASRDYEERRAERKEEAAKRAERVAERKEHRRIKYLERSPKLRGAARGLRDWVFSRDSSPNGEISCMYCGARLAKKSAHLEHKRPLVRGGNNRLHNLGIACASCNLSKGRKTHDEFLQWRSFENQKKR